jgi:hypothetical protein
MATSGPEDAMSPTSSPPNTAVAVDAAATLDFSENRVTHFVKPEETDLENHEVQKIELRDALPPEVVQTPVKQFHPNQEANDDDRMDADDLSDEHIKVLILLYLYAKTSSSVDEPEEWVRQIPLQVLIYEGIVGKLLDFDYAPVSTMIAYNQSSIRVWFNVSQEAQTAIDDLRVGGFFNSLKVVTVDERAQTMFQVSKAGIDFLRERAPQELFDQVANFVFAQLPRDCWTRLMPGQTPAMVNPKADPKMQCVFDPDMKKGEEPDKEQENERNPVKPTRGFRIRHGDPRTGEILSEKPSKVTETEDVSYVTSPYMPQCLLTEKFRNKAGFHCNKHRLPDLVGAATEIEDDLDEIIALSNCVACVCEYIPFGANQLSALNTRLGVLDRLKNTFLSSKIDENPMETVLQLAPGLVSTDVVDCDFASFVNFSSQINLPEEGDIVQVEEIGMHINVDGTIVYGQKIEGIGNHCTEDNITLDQLSRLLVDIHEDTSKIMESLLSPVQQNQLEFVFAGDPENRGKYNLIFADKIHPANGLDPTFDYLDVNNYMNRSDNENEVKQILSDITGAHLIGSTDVLIIGRGGLILAGPNVIGNTMAETLFVDFMKLQIIGIFVNQFSMRHINVELNLAEATGYIEHYTENPLYIDKFRTLLANSTRECILLSELVQYLEVSLLQVERSVLAKDGSYSKDRGAEEALCAEIWDVLGLKKQLRSHRNRLKDLNKKCDSSMKTVTVQNMKGNTANVARLTETATKIEMNFKKLVDGLDAQLRSAGATELMSNIFSSNLAFIIMDRLDGDAFLGFEGTGIGNVNSITGELPLWWVVEYIQNPFIHIVPMLFFFVNILWLLLFIYLLDKMKQRTQEEGKGVEQHTITFNKKVFLDKLETVYVDQNIIQTDVGAEKIIMWDDTRAEWWCGCEPKITMRYNTGNSFITKVAMQWQNTKTDFDEHEMANAFRLLLEENGVFDTDFMVKKIDKHSGRELASKQTNSFLDRWYEFVDLTPKAPKVFSPLKSLRRVTMMAKEASSPKAEAAAPAEAKKDGRRGSRLFPVKEGQMCVQERIYMKRSKYKKLMEEEAAKKEASSLGKTRQMARKMSTRNITPVQQDDLLRNARG